MKIVIICLCFMLSACGKAREHYDTIKLYQKHGINLDGKFNIKLSQNKIIITRSKSGFGWDYDTKHNIIYIRYKRKF